MVEPLSTSGTVGLPVQMVGFQGIGALGGGNVTVDIGGNAGQMTDRDEGGAGPAQQGAVTQRGEGLIIAVGSTGRLLPGTTVPKLTGGGDITVNIGGTLNPIDAAAYGIGAYAGGPGAGQSNESPAVNGDIIDIRGQCQRDGLVRSGVSTRSTTPPPSRWPIRARSIRSHSEDGIPNGGIEVVPGDGTVSVSTLRDLVLAGAADPGRVTEQNFTDLGIYHQGVGNQANDGGDNRLHALAGRHEHQPVLRRRQRDANDGAEREQCGTDLRQ